MIGKNVKKIVYDNKHEIVNGLSDNTENTKNVLSQYYHAHIEASKDGIFYKGKNVLILKIL